MIDFPRVIILMFALKRNDMGTGGRLWERRSPKTVGRRELRRSADFSNFPISGYKNIIWMLSILFKILPCTSAQWVWILPLNLNLIFLVLFLALSPRKFTEPHWIVPVEVVEYSSQMVAQCFWCKYFAHIFILYSKFSKKMYLNTATYLLWVSGVGCLCLGGKEGSVTIFRKLAVIQAPPERYSLLSPLARVIFT